MGTINEDWCHCPICLEIYSVEHRPTTFICGHSVCINHVYGEKSLEECPICRRPLKSFGQYHISYSLEEAVRVYTSVKNSIDWNILMARKKEEPQKPTAVKSNYSYEENLMRNECRLDEMFSPQTKSPDYQSHLVTYNSRCIHTSHSRKSRANGNDRYCPVCKKRC